MEFQNRYLQALRENDPKGFNQLRRSGQLDAYLKQKTAEAYQLRRQLLASQPKDPQSVRAVEEQVMALMLEAPSLESELREPPNDLKTLTSKAPTTASSRVK